MVYPPIDRGTSAGSQVQPGRVVSVATSELLITTDLSSS